MARPPRAARVAALHRRRPRALFVRSPSPKRCSMSKFVSRSTACLLTALPLVVAVSAAIAGDPLPDPVFADGFDGAPPSISRYDDLEESFLGTSYAYNGVSYHDVN